VQALRDRAAEEPGLLLLEVDHVYQQARRGTKAIVRHDNFGSYRDAWFWWARVQPGQMVLVHATNGWGPHTGRDNVLYVGGERTGAGVLEVVDPRTLAAARRHYRTHPD
jgi:hypothetical protein